MPYLAEIYVSSDGYKDLISEWEELYSKNLEEADKIIGKAIDEFRALVVRANPKRLERIQSWPDSVYWVPTYLNGKVFVVHRIHPEQPPGSKWTKHPQPGGIWLQAPTARPRPTEYTLLRICSRSQIGQDISLFRVALTGAVRGRKDYLNRNVFLTDMHIKHGLVKSAPPVPQYSRGCAIAILVIATLILFKACS